MFIQFGKLNFYLLIIVLFPLSKHFIKLLMKGRNNNHSNIVFENFITYFSLIFVGILYLITKILTKTEKTENDKYLEQKEIKIKTKAKENKDNKNINVFQELELKELKKKNIEKRNQYLFIILISYIHFSGMLINNLLKREVSLFKREIPTQLLLNIIVLLTFLLLMLFSKIFLGFTFFKHQYFSLVIILLCLIIFIVQSYIAEQKPLYETIKESLIDFLFIFFYEIFYCLADALGKKYLNKYLDGVYLFLFKFGMVTSIPFLIYDSIAFLCNTDEKYHGVIRAIFRDGMPFLDILLKIGFIFLNNLGIWLTIYYFSPCHVIIYMIIDNFFGIIFSTFTNSSAEKNWQIISYYIIYPILIFFVLVFNEIIIFNFWNLNYNTKLYIEKRTELEKEIINGNELANARSRSSINSVCSQDEPDYTEKNEIDEKLIL